MTTFEMILRLKLRILKLGGTVPRPSPWEDDPLMYANTLLEVVEDLEGK